MARLVQMGRVAVDIWATSVVRRYGSLHLTRHQVVRFRCGRILAPLQLADGDAVGAGIVVGDIL